ncbi:Efhb [Symbiodinium sp. KB8]|nr:Efhb [Symbiodinium sp. KB8]
MLKDGQGAALALKPDLDPGEKPLVTAPRPIPLTFHSLHMSPSLLVLLYRCHLRTLFSGSSDPTQMPFPAGAIKRSDEFTAEDCIVGGYSIEEQLPDQDLGRSVRPGFRNFTKDPNRVFGLPSIRRDIPSKHTVWFSMLLLNGSSFAELGVDDNDFVEPRNQREIRDIFERIGYSLDDGEFRAIWRRAADHYDLNGNGVVSIEEFRLALNEYLDAQDEGKTPDWFTE